MNIGKFARSCGLSAYTLRYYEKIGLLSSISRTSGNHREYSEDDIAWVAFIKRLKETNMPLAEIRRYAVLRSQGRSTESERLDMLVSHASRLEEVLRQNREHLKKLHEKIKIYQRSIKEKKST